MCMLLYRPEGLEIGIPDRWIDHFWERNSDGFGAFWLDAGGGIEIKRTMDKTEARDIVKWIVEHKVEAGMHWRHGTSGSKTMPNVHPFVLHHGKGGKARFVLAHNGVMGEWQQYASDKDASDTRGFIEAAFLPLARRMGAAEFWRKDSPAQLLTLSAIGRSNRLLLAHPEHGFIRYGGWDGGVFRGMSASNSYAWAHARALEDSPDFPTTSYHGNDGGHGNNRSHYQGPYDRLSLYERSAKVFPGPFEVGQPYPVRELGYHILVTEVKNNNKNDFYPVKGKIMNSVTLAMVTTATLTADGWFNEFNRKPREHPYDAVGPAMKTVAGVLVREYVGGGYWKGKQDRVPNDPYDTVCAESGFFCDPPCKPCQAALERMGEGELGQGPAANENAPAAAAAASEAKPPEEGDKKKLSGTRGPLPEAGRSPTGSLVSSPSDIDTEDDESGDDETEGKEIVEGMTAEDFLSLSDQTLEEWCFEESEMAAEAIKVLCWRDVIRRRIEGKEIDDDF